MIETNSEINQLIVLSFYQLDKCTKTCFDSVGQFDKKCIVSTV